MPDWNGLIQLLMGWFQAQSFGEWLLGLLRAVGIVAVVALVVACPAMTAGCFDPMYYANQYLQSEAGQKLVDRAEVKGSAENPAIEVYAITGFGLRAIGVKSSAGFSGEVTEDERGYADGSADEPGAASQPAVEPSSTTQPAIEPTHDNSGDETGVESGGESSPPG